MSGYYRCNQRIPPLYVKALKFFPLMGAVQNGIDQLEGGNTELCNRHFWEGVV